MAVKILEDYRGLTVKKRPITTVEDQEVWDNPRNRGYSRCASIFFSVDQCCKVHGHSTPHFSLNALHCVLVSWEDVPAQQNLVATVYKRATYGISPNDVQEAMFGGEGVKTDIVKVRKAKSHNCECGAHAVGVPPKNPGHSSWCPEYGA